jgi:hypothetical protein
VSYSVHTVLSGRVQLFVLAVIERADATTIVGRPYVIATLVNMATAGADKSYRWQRGLELHIDEIDSFARVRAEPFPSSGELCVLRDLPENDVKCAVAEIIGEPYVPSDWGGEASDLVTNRLVLDGHRVNAAFVFKGPSKWGPLSLARLGKNGDQLARAFSEPVDLALIQHCERIQSAVRHHCRALAADLARPCLFSLIDGADTLWLLRAYGKCGLEPSTPAKALSN